MELFQQLYAFFAAATGLSLLVLFIGLAALIFKRYFLPDFSRGGPIRNRLSGHSRGAR